VNDEAPNSQGSEWDRAVRIGRLLNEWVDGSYPPGERPSSDTTNGGDGVELESLIAVVDAMAISRTGIRSLIRQGVLRASPDPAFLAELVRYGIVAIVGQGGMGVVLRAFDRTLGRDVALKIMQADLAADPGTRARFQREAKATAQLRHPNIVTIHEVGEADGHPFLVMEYVEGPSLADYIRDRGPLDGREAGVIFRSIIEGLAHAHEAGIIHRDIKAANILLDRRQGTVKIADFGLAHIVGDQTRITLPNAVFGTTAYMSPEQARGCERVDGRSDLYSAGVVLYEMLTGRVPFQAGSPSAVVHKILNDIPEVPSKLVDRVDLHLADMAIRLIAKRPEDRFDSAKAALRALDRPVAFTIPERRRRWFRRVAILLAIGVMATGAVLLWTSATARYAGIGERGRLVEVAPDRLHGGSAQRIVGRFGDDMTWRTFYEFNDDGVFVRNTVIADVDVAGTKVVVASLLDRSRGDALYVISDRGEKLWSLKASGDHTWPDTSAEILPWECNHLLVRDLDNVPGDEVLAECHGENYPTRISILDLEHRRFGPTFWHMGHIIQACILDDFFGDGRPAVAAIGLNNKLDGFEDEALTPQTPSHWDITSVVMILDPLDMNGLGPPQTDRVPDLPRATPIAYALLDMPYARNALRVDNDPKTGKRVLLKNNPALEEDGSLGMAELQPVELGDAEQRPFLLIQLAGRDSQNNLRAPGGLLVDRNLVPISFKPTNTGGETREYSLGYWKAHWKILKPGGTWVSP